MKYLIFYSNILNTSTNSILKFLSLFLIIKSYNDFQWISCFLLHVQSKNYHLISNQANEDLRIQFLVLFKVLNKKSINIIKFIFYLP